jgi:hypothetical protein
MSQEMSVKQDLKCIFNMPEQLNSSFDRDQEEFHSLPPHAPVDVYPVDEYESCPANWTHGSDVASSYFVGVKEKHGMWLDFNECFYHTHDVAIVISIQGINPITGQKMVAEKALKLEQYHKKCPIHNVDYKQDRYCEKCGFKWPGQNYLATTGTPEMMLWLDGFRTPEGTVRQYIFTEDEIRGVASQLIGKERVFAIGIAYYLSKNKKPYTLQRPEERVFTDSYAGRKFFSPMHTSGNWSKAARIGASGCDSKSSGSDIKMEALDLSDEISMLFDDSPSYTESLGVDDSDMMIGASDNDDLSTNGLLKGIITPDAGDDGDRATVCTVNGSAMPSSSTPTSSSALRQRKSITPVKQLEIGAGALIQQRVYDDPKVLTYWEEKPAGMIYINYCDEETKKRILDAGRRADEKDGFMQDIKVGG